MSNCARFFGYGEFLPGQAEVLASVLAGRDTLAVLPTGGGKSVCYQLPALLLDGLTLVVSPLLALMKDQVDALTRNGVAAAAINSTVPREEQADILRRVADGDLRLLYVAPERFSDGRFVAALRGVNVALLAIDEAHCISQWGHDFRPSYRDLGAARARLNDPPIVALTATADPRVRDDIVERLGLHDPDIRIAGFDRPNLRFHALRVRSQKEKLEQIAELLEALGEEASAIVYCATRKRVESLVEALQRRRVRCARYHAGMPEDDRVRIQNAFARDSLRIIVDDQRFWPRHRQARRPPRRPPRPARIHRVLLPGGGPRRPRRRPRRVRSLLRPPRPWPARVLHRALPSPACDRARGLSRPRAARR